ncbi:MAG: sodium:proton antiporter [Tissierella sp.]|uniref:sodium:proton antiporter n=1 Tax=Tissierella sp. TaxID=41274 RepID=UPI003F9431FB
MKILLRKLMVNYPYTIAIILFVIGILIVLTKSDLFKKLIGINIMESSIFIMFVGAGNIRGAAVPILDKASPQSTYINPLPSALMLTGIVVSVSVTAFALALIIRLHKSYGTTDAKKIAEMRNEVTNK